MCMLHVHVHVVVVVVVVHVHVVVVVHVVTLLSDAMRDLVVSPAMGVSTLEQGVVWTRE